jgi:hypothetical protein
LGILSFAFVALAVTIVFFYPFKHPLNDELGSASVVILPFLALQPLCALWMLYQAIRYEAKPLPYFLLAAFFPFSYIWYYSERVRPRKRARL